jgi:nucleoside phosphorylase
LLGIIASVALNLPLSQRAAAVVPASPCQRQLLVLSAFPAELDAVLARARFRVRDARIVAGHTFYPGHLGGRRVIMAMTGIGPVNAHNTTTVALEHFRCIDGVVFSGVAGSYASIGDVMVPERWSGDAGATWLPVDAHLLDVARQVAAAGTARLAQDASPAGDPACVCDGGPLRPVHLPNAPRVIVGGDGFTTDPFGGRAFPCAPFAGDVFGCQPCRGRKPSVADAVAFVSGIGPFLGPDFFLSYLQSPEASSTPAAAGDEESAAVAEVAAAHQVPFIAFRSVSDGANDPLMLPGFPVQFFVYRQISANNAAAATLAFMRALG